MGSNQSSTGSQEKRVHVGPCAAIVYRRGPRLQVQVDGAPEQYVPLPAALVRIPPVEIRLRLRHSAHCTRYLSPPPSFLTDVPLRFVCPTAAVHTFRKNLLWNLLLRRD
ncbi:hypothetical protein ACQJBY_028718 [Aegilops geniculata]